MQPIVICAGWQYKTNKNNGQNYIFNLWRSRNKLQMRNGKQFLKNTIMKTIILLDNGGETFDRFTFINTKTGDVLGTSETGDGFFQYAGNIADNYMGVTFGYSWRKHCNIKECIKDSVQRFLSDCENVGKLRELNTIDTNLLKRAKEYLTTNKK